MSNALDLSLAGSDNVESFVGGGGPGGAGNALLLEDGVSGLLLEDGTSFLLLESG